MEQTSGRKTKPRKDLLAINKHLYGNGELAQHFQTRKTATPVVHIEDNNLRGSKQKRQHFQIGKENGSALYNDIGRNYN